MPKSKTTFKDQLAAHKTLWIVLGLVVVLGLATWAWSASQGGYKALVITPQKSSPSPSASSANAGQPSSRNLDTPTPTPVQATQQPGTPLPPPSGNMLNVHTASLTTGPGLVTTCATQAGAKCYVQAKASDGTIKATADMTADSNGSAEIHWTAKGAGLTAGSWEIRVVASNGSGSTTSTIFDTLVVTP